MKNPLLPHPDLAPARTPEQDIARKVGHWDLMSAAAQRSANQWARAVAIARFSRENSTEPLYHLPRT